MCVAIYKPKGIKAPSIETLKKCWDANPHGAGLAWRTSGKFPIHIEKGFMKWEDFESYWKSMSLENYDSDMFIHFRITTHGGTSAGNTHPFPIVDNDELLKTHSVSCKYTMMHNGILPIKPDNVNISDTMMLAKLIARGKFESNVKAVSNLLDGFVGTNKLAFMDADNVYLIGAWKNIDGVMFSNDYWDWNCSSFLKHKDECMKDGKRYEAYEYEDDDDYYVTSTTDEELMVLQEGICPWCKSDDGVDEYDDCYICNICGVVYEKPSEKEKDDDAELAEFYGLDL